MRIHDQRAVPIVGGHLDQIAGFAAIASVCSGVDLGIEIGTEYGKSRLAGHDRREASSVVFTFGFRDGVRIGVGVIGRAAAVARREAERSGEDQTDDTGERPAVMVAHGSLLMSDSYYLRESSRSFGQFGDLCRA